MKLYYITIQIAIAGYLTIQTAANKPLAVLTLPNAPFSSIEENDLDDYTYMKGESGIITKIPAHLARIEQEPLFNPPSDIFLELFTPKNPTERSLLIPNDSTSVTTSNFDSARPTRIFIHGWNSDGSYTPQFAKTYFQNDSYNVNFIAVNWQKGSTTINYFLARGRVKYVGEYLAKFIDFMAEKHRLRLNDVTLIGHSLGAHVAGIAAKNMAKGKVSKIVGLDPALPFFSYNDVQGRLADTDAEYVEVIHTCAGKLGYSKPIGQASFYPNGGAYQPGCSKIDIIGMCAHSRSVEYYIESIATPSFYALQCESIDNIYKGECHVIDGLTQMGGEPGIKQAKGIFYLETHGEPMFSKGIGSLFRLFDSSKYTSKLNNFAKMFPKMISVLKDKLENIEPNKT